MRTIQLPGVLATILGLGWMSASAVAQNTYPWPQTGNVGIGSTGSASFRLSLVPPGDGTINALYLGAADGSNEGAEIDWKGAGSYPSWVTDIYRDTFRIITGTTTNTRVDIFNAGSGLANLYVEGSVGIGTDSPGSKLEIAGGGLTISNAGDNVLTTKQGVNTYHLIGTYSGWSPNTVYLAGYNTVNNSGASKVASVSIGGGGSERVWVDLASGNTGIGTTGPATKLDVRGSYAQNTYTVTSTTPEDLRVLCADNRSLDGGVITIGGAWGATGYIKTAAYDGRAGALIIGNRRSASDETMQPGIVLDQSGRVGIGVTGPSHQLTVNGTIRAKEVIVDTGWADYVFAEDYRLAPLSEVEAHIKEHKHLPGVPSAAEVAENGVSMGEMQARMMAKIEELMLHVIEQEKRAHAQAAEIEGLKSQNSQLQSQVRELINR